MVVIVNQVEMKYMIARWYVRFRASGELILNDRVAAWSAWGE